MKAKKIMSLCVAVLFTFLITSCGIPENSSSSEPSSTPSSSDVSNNTSSNDSSSADSSNDTSASSNTENSSQNSSVTENPNDISSELGNFKELLESGKFAELFAQEEYGFNNGIESDFEFNKEAFGTLKIKLLYSVRDNSNIASKYFYRLQYESVLKNALLGNRRKDGLIKIVYEVIDSGNTDLPLGIVERYLTADGGGYYNDTAFLEFIDQYHQPISKDTLKMAESPLSCVGVALANYFSHYGLKEFNGFSAEEDIYFEVKESLPGSLYIISSYPSADPNFFDAANSYVEKMFGIKNYYEYDEETLVVTCGGKPMQPPGYTPESWKGEVWFKYSGDEYSPYIFSHEGLALSNFTQDGDNLYLDFTSYLDNLGFFLNYRYRITLRLLPETDENGLRYVRIVSGEFIE